MIIWGSKGRTKRVQTGQFYCPRCATLCPYDLLRVSKYFTLYFIPLFPTSTLGEFVECKVCFTTFKPEVLTYTPSTWSSHSSDPALQKIVQGIASELDRGIPLQVIARALTDKGVTQHAAAIALFLATQGKTKTCSRCGSVYKATLSYCSACGTQLTTAAPSA